MNKSRMFLKSLKRLKTILMNSNISAGYCVIDRLIKAKTKNAYNKWKF